MTTDTPTVGKIEYAPDYQSRQAVVPVADIEATATKIARLERDLRECVELLDEWCNRKPEPGWFNRAQALVARLKGKP